MSFLNFLFKKPNARFEKVIFNQYVSDWIDCLESDPDSPPDVDVLHTIWDGIELPKRSTDGSAGYDFTLPFGFKLKKGESITIPTGICCKMEKSEFLMIVPRSGQGFKYRVSLVNTAGIIDADYFNNTDSDVINSQLNLFSSNLHRQQSIMYLQKI